MWYRINTMSVKKIDIIRANKNVRYSLIIFCILVVTFALQYYIDGFLGVVFLSLFVGCIFVLPIIVTISIFSLIKQTREIKQIGYIKETPRTNAIYYRKKAFVCLILALILGIVIIISQISLSSQANRGDSGTEFVAFFGILPLLFLLIASTVGSILFALAFVIQRRKEQDNLR